MYKCKELISNNDNYINYDNNKWMNEFNDIIVRIRIFLSEL